MIFHVDNYLNQCKHGPYRKAAGHSPEEHSEISHRVGIDRDGTDSGDYTESDES